MLGDHILYSRDFSDWEGVEQKFDADHEKVRNGGVWQPVIVDQWLDKQNPELPRLWSVNLLSYRKKCIVERLIFIQLSEISAEQI